MDCPEGVAGNLGCLNVAIWVTSTWRGRGEKLTVFSHARRESARQEPSSLNRASLARLSDRKASPMSVIVLARFPVSDVARARASLAENAALLEEITEDTKKLGIIHHLFAVGENEVIVIDEWDKAESFQNFFNANPKVEKITTDAGVKGPPTVEVFEHADAAGTF